MTPIDTIEEDRERDIVEDYSTLAGAVADVVRLYEHDYRSPELTDAIAALRALLVAQGAFA